MLRAPLLALPATVLIVTAWLRLEDGRADSRAIALALLAVLPAVVRPWWGRALATATVVPVAVGTALGVSPLDARPFSGRDFFRPAWDRFREGTLEYWEVAQPFAAADHPLMHGVLLVAVFGFCLVVSLALAANRPLLAGLALVAGSMWPATLVTGSDLARGAVTLALVLLYLASGRDRPPRSLRPALVAGVALVAAAVAASTSPAVSKAEFLSWKTWDLYDRPAKPVSVRYVWDANYAGIEFPEERTVVLQIAAPKEKQYWRATSLDTFADDRWVEDVGYRGTLESRGAVPGELLPARSQNRRLWTRMEVRVEALDDENVVAGAMPMLVDPGDAGRVDYYTSGVLKALAPLGRSSEYAVFNFTPKPSPGRLAQERYPAHAARPELARYLALAPDVPAPLFGRPGQRQAVERMVEAEGLQSYAPLHRTAREVVGNVRNPYAAVVALEAWFRSSGEFDYEERPGLRLDRPPLVDFVTRAREGYCQHFAGAMALMLRYLGIPARVGAGFTAGTYDRDRGVWRVHDTDAHTWVEAWFPRFGWLSFDPTPGRGSLSGAYTSSSAGFNAGEAARALGAGIFDGRNDPQQRSFAEQFGERLARGEDAVSGRDAPGDLSSGGSFPFAGQRRGESLLQLMLIVAAVAAGALATGKLAVRRSRYLTRDPRRLAGACRRELVEFLADQGLVVPRSATLAEAGALVSNRLGVDARAFVQAATQARYSPPDEAAAASRQARRELRRLLRGVRRRVGVPRRLRGAVSLRSLAV